MMRFFIEMTERTTADPQELAAMLKHRMDSIQYQQKLIEEGKLIYSFKSADGLKTYLALYADSVEQIDNQIKADPLFPYAYVSTSPVIPLKQLVEEIHNYLGEVILPKEEVEKLATPPTPPRREGESYFLARKVVKPFSPLLSEDEQKDIARRTVLAQAYHWTELEVYDENPVGQPVGILIAKAQTAAEVVSHVSECEVYPDTEMEVIPLHTLEESHARAQEIMNALRPPLDYQKYVLLNNEAE